ncbi:MULTISPECIES: hypothetical protein [unclassified Streptomyces]|uniref:hypothetical protein n=1 Tax=unclassified Streptomyces TaxID=2593676 RepID=UPI000B7214F6|nr:MULTISPECIES: hypothetical protein [unclassified Streptomyces]SNB89764.1 hypothetical protein SAMN02745831_06056 [Streptomyces sp. PgraA7]
MARMLKAALPVVALVVLGAGCSSAQGQDDQRLTERRENYCTQLGGWQKTRNAAAEDAPDPDEYDEVGAAAQDVLLAMRPLRDEPVGQGRTLGEATAAATENSDPEAEGLAVRYCGEVGFETLTR